MENIKLTKEMTYEDICNQELIGRNVHEMFEGMEIEYEKGYQSDFRTIKKIEVYKIEKINFLGYLIYTDLDDEILFYNRNDETLCYVKKHTFE
jgi:hypothetical protein